MTDIYTGNQDIIDRYLANRLGDAERQLVETRIVTDPNFRNELELTEALRDGLRQLEAQGGIAPLLRPQTWMWSRAPFAVAASLLAILLGAVSFLVFQRFDQPRDEVKPASGELVVATLRFERTRGDPAGPDVSWSRPAAPALLEMRFDVGLEPAPGYQVFIEKIRAGSATSLLMSTLAGTNANGEVAISIHSELLEPGDYRIRLDPQPGDAMQQEPTIYTLRVTG